MPAVFPNARTIRRRGSEPPTNPTRISNSIDNSPFPIIIRGDVVINDSSEVLSLGTTGSKPWWTPTCWVLVPVTPGEERVLGEERTQWHNSEGHIREGTRRWQEPAQHKVDVRRREDRWQAKPRRSSASLGKLIFGDSVGNGIHSYHPLPSYWSKEGCRLWFKSMCQVPYASEIIWMESSVDSSLFRTCIADKKALIA